jgi:hypothetical protein
MAFGDWVGTRDTPGQTLKLGAFMVDGDGEPQTGLGEVAFTVNTDLSAAAGERVEARCTRSSGWVGIEPVRFQRRRYSPRVAPASRGAC